jgi:hypothetical protein
MKPAAVNERGVAGKVRRLAQVGFWFFLIKGLLWLLIPAAAFWLGRLAHWF